MGGKKKNPGFIELSLFYFYNSVIIIIIIIIIIIKINKRYCCTRLHIQY